MKNVKSIIWSKLSKVLTIFLIGAIIINGDVMAAPKGSVEFKEKSKILSIGNSYNAKMVNLPKKAICSWTSSNKKVATVSNKGKIKAIKKGKVTISCIVKVGKKNQTIKMKIQVKEPTFKKESGKLVYGDNMTISIKNKPKEEVYKWKTSEKAIATINSKGKIVGQKVGKAKISVKITWKEGKKTKEKTLNYDLNVVQNRTIRNKTTINLNKGYLYCVGDAVIKDNTILKFMNINDYMRVDGLFKWINRYATLEKGTLELHGDLEYDISLNLSSELFKVQFSGDIQQNIIQPNTVTRTAFGNLINNNSEAGIHSNIPLNIINLERNGNKITYGTEENHNYGWTLYEDQVIEGDLYLTKDTLDLNGHTLRIEGDLFHSSGKVLINGGNLVIEGDYLQQYIYKEENTIKYSNSTSLLIMNNENDEVHIKGNYYNDSIANSTGYLTKGEMSIEGDFTVTNSSNYSFVAQYEHILVLAGDKEQKIEFLNNTYNKNYSGLAHLEYEKDQKGSITFVSTIVKEGYQPDGMAHDGCLYFYLGAIKDIEKVYGNVAFMEMATISNMVEIEGDLTIYELITLANNLVVYKNIEVIT